ncbi:MAG: NUDIX hydrolase [Oenococcus sp.]|uniref:NUDIX hydrolase n=1 Tax=Oenococcus sp. TaxID=1979414 RepID=UPI0039EBCEDA
MTEKGKILRETKEFHGQIFDVVDRKIHTPDGLTVDRQVVLHGDAVAFVAPIRIDGGIKLALGREYRAGLNAERTSFPAGLINPGEDPKTAALREAREELGLSYRDAKEIFLISTSEGFTNEATHLMLLSGLIGKSGKHFDPSEFVKTLFVTFDELEQLILSGKVTTAPGIIAYQWLKLHPESLAAI